MVSTADAHSIGALVGVVPGMTRRIMLVVPEPGAGIFAIRLFSWVILTDKRGGQSRQKDTGFRPFRGIGYDESSECRDDEVSGPGGEGLAQFVRIVIGGDEGFAELAQQHQANIAVEGFLVDGHHFEILVYTDLRWRPYR